MPIQPKTPKEHPLLDKIRTKNSAYWSNVENKMRFELFHDMAERVPAYKAFLKAHDVSPKSIRSTADLKHVPPITKKNYLKKYTLKDLSWDGNLNDQLVLTSTSGSTGNPVYFTRNRIVDEQSSVIHELYFKNKGFSQKEPTLVIVAFGMGVWIGGTITYQACKYIQERGYPLSIITPGINKPEIIRILKQVAPQYKQIIIAGYPPFLKDIADEMRRRRIALPQAKIRLLFAAEPFTEKFRSYVTEKFKAQSTVLDTMNIYGTADIGTMAFETPLSIAIRQEAMGNDAIFHNLFPAGAKTPTFAQYIPTQISFEAVDDELFISGHSSIPLMRYRIGDCGGRLSYDEVSSTLKAAGGSQTQIAKDYNIKPYRYQLPFVYVYERSDFSTSLYGLQVYPEPIREVLLQKQFHKYLSGKFSMTTRFDSKQDQYLEINLERKKGATMPNKKVRDKLCADIVSKLGKSNAEFRELHNYLGNRAKPVLRFFDAEHTEYFKPGVKQKWVIK